MVARPLLVLAVTGSAIHLGLVIATRSISSVAFGLVAGVIADRFDRRIVLLGTKSIVFGLSGLFAMLVILDIIQLWHIYLLTFLRGATQAFDQPAAHRAYDGHPAVASSIRRGGIRVEVDAVLGKAL